MITYILISISNIRCNETEALMSNTHVKDLDLLQQVKNKQITFFFFFFFFFKQSPEFEIGSTPSSSGSRHCSWSCCNCVGLDLEHNTSNSSQVGQRGLPLREDELEISQQVAREQKELHSGNRLPQAEAGPSSERHQGTCGASSSLQKAL